MKSITFPGGENIHVMPVTQDQIQGQAETMTGNLLRRYLLTTDNAERIKISDEIMYINKEAKKVLKSYNN